MLAASRKPVETVVHQHAEDSTIPRHTRSVMMRAPHATLHHLAPLDERIAAHLDGLAVAGEYRTETWEAALEVPEVGEVFASAVRPIEDQDKAHLDKLFALGNAASQARRGLISALHRPKLSADLVVARIPL